MNVGTAPPVTKHPAKLSILLMDSNAERRALRVKVLGSRGAEVVGLGDLAEAVLMGQRDRYDLVLIDIRRDYPGGLACRDEIKKENPKQLVAFLVGRPTYVELEPLPDSYVAEGQGVEWGDLLRQQVRESCKSLSQRNGFAEVGYQIALARKMRGLPPKEPPPGIELPSLAEIPLEEALYHPTDE
jgi:CheY-like chemotaxis protein